MKYLVEHYDTFYYRRKLQYQNICISLQTKNKLEANYILSIINSKIEAMRYTMNFEEERSYIKSLLKKYVDVAKDEYGELAMKREEKYASTIDGKDMLGSHPNAIDKAVSSLQDDLFSTKKEDVANTIIEDSNISQEDFKKAITSLSPSGQQRLVNEVIKSEIEILYYDKSRNEQRTNEDKFVPTYIDELSSSNAQKNISVPVNAMEIINIIKEEETTKYRLKTKYEVYEEYIAQEEATKSKYMDKIELPLMTYLLSSEKEYLVEYDLKDCERFFQALIYTPSRINQKKEIFLDYDENYVLIAEDFRDCLEGESELFSHYKSNYKLNLQSASNVDDKLSEFNSFMLFCSKNNYIKDNYFKDNSKFSKKRFENILAGQRKREPFNVEELKKMLTKLANIIEKKNFKKENIYIPLIGFYSGMRVEEIAKLKTEDIKDEDGIYYFDVNGMVKTKESIRKVPIHSDLIKKFKFLEYVDKRKNADEEQLFPLTCIMHKDKLKYSHYFLRDFFTPFRDNLIEEERVEENLISFHSYRHTFATRLLQGGVEFYSISELLGHTIDTVLKNTLDLQAKRTETPRYTHSNLLKNLQDNIEKLYIEDFKVNIEKFEVIIKKYFK